MSTADSAPPFVPAGHPLTSFFWEGAREGRLLIQRCERCGSFQHPPRELCRHCQSFALGHAAVSGRATLYSYTVAVQAFHPWFASRVPYLLAVVELVEQAELRLVTNLVGCSEDDVVIGMDLEVTFERLSDALTLPVFRPAGGAS